MSRAGWPGKLARLSRSLSAAQAAPDDAWATLWLNAGERSVYLRMDPRDREHAVRVARRLIAELPGTSAELVAAALLHDCGKCERPYRVWERVSAGLVPVSVAHALPVGALEIRARHPLVGADLLRAAGARARVADLVARHHAPGEDAEARLLHHYDDLE